MGSEIAISQVEIRGPAVRAQLQQVPIVLGGTLKSLASQDRNWRVTFRFGNELLEPTSVSGLAQLIEARLDRHARR